MVMASLLGSCGGGDDPILIGISGPFAQPRGQSMRLGAELARDEINAAGGINGRMVELVAIDDSADADVAVQAARRFYDTPGVVAVIGHMTSGATLAAAPIYNGGRDPLVEISSAASSPELSAAGDYTFRVHPTDLVHGARLAQWARSRLQADSVAVLYLNDDYGRGVRTTFAQSFQAAGGIVVAEDPYVADIATFEPYLRRIHLRHNVDAIMIAGTRADAVRIIATMDSVGLRARILGGDALTGLETAGSRAEGAHVSTAYLPDRPGARNTAFVAAYRRAFADQKPDHRGAGSYDIVHLLARAIAEAGADRAKIRDYLAGVGTATPAFDGVTGPIAFDENGDVPAKDVVIGIVRNGALVTASGQ
jgi:branched-chain amino acid transport system substrate-binding protein